MTWTGILAPCSECGTRVELVLAGDFQRDSRFSGRYHAWVDPETGVPHECLTFARADTRATA